MTAEAQDGADRALPTAHEVLSGVYARVGPLDRVALHAALLAERDRHDHASKILTQMADHVRRGVAEQLGSQQKAAEALGVGRRTVRRRNKSKQEA